ncbi:MAG TPA: GrpB family protein [Bacteroidia bacterium]|nr:GrpB family protein [Bacteroidia bacterium]
MKIQLEKYNPDWTTIYKDIEADLRHSISFLNPKIEHIGSTSIVDMKSKPIIDILVGIHEQDQLDNVVEPLTRKGYIYYEKYNSVMPYRRFFVKLKNKPDFLISKVYCEKDEVPNELNDYRLAHIHVLEYNSYHWKRHIAFREYLKIHTDIKNEYQKMKIQLSVLEWRDGNEYNNAKNEFIKRTEKKAIEWYDEKNNSN